MTPRAFSRPISASTCATWRTLIAAVGSSISTMLGSASRVRAIATAWRWPPDIVLHQVARPGLRLQLGEELAGARAIAAVVEEAERPDPPLQLAAEEDVVSAAVRLSQSARSW